jgi:hypothetical protein
METLAQIGTTSTQRTAVPLIIILTLSTLVLNAAHVMSHLGVLILCFP